MARPIVMPSLGMYTAEGTLTTWLRPPGTAVGAGEVVAEITTEKATYEIEAPEEGLLHVVAEVGVTVPVQGLIGYVLAPGEAPPAVAAGSAPSAIVASEPPRSITRPAPAPPAGGSALPPAEVKASPVARRLAAQHGLELAGLAGSGPGGRIVEADVLAAIARREAASAGPPPDARRVRQRIPLIGIRRTIAERLRHSLATAAPVTLTREASAAALVAARGPLAARLGTSVPYDALFITILAAALREDPTFNAVIEDDTVLVLDEIHIGFAVAAPSGLLVPVVSEADRRPLAEVVAAVGSLAERARAGRLRAEEMAGGTATITNLGAYGVDAFTPILNPPQSVILGIGRITPRPVWEEERWLARPTCLLSLTFDHRVADGAPAARLLEAIVGRMADATYLAGLA